MRQYRDERCADSWENLGCSAEAPASINNSSVQHVNGLSVYQEGRGPNGEQGAFMVSAVVAATPREVFSVSLCCQSHASKSFHHWLLCSEIEYRSTERITTASCTNVYCGRNSASPKDWATFDIQFLMINLEEQSLRVQPFGKQSLSDGLLLVF